MKGRVVLFDAAWQLRALLLCFAFTGTSAQTPPDIRLLDPAGQPVLSITGAVGSVCTVQYTAALGQTNAWQFLTNVTLAQGSYLVADPSAATASRFYRAFLQIVPTNVVTTNMIWVSPGTFVMGSPTNEPLRGLDETQHAVTVTRGFWMGQYLVTQNDYLTVVTNNPSYFQGDLTRPVEQVSWNDATNYCALRTQQEQALGLIPTNYVYRLPTEAEWEYACRAGTTTAFYLGSSLRSGQANFDGLYEYDAAVGPVYNPNGVYLSTTTPVGSYAANPWGLYDMAGNLWEWCQDWYDSYPVGSATNPQGPATGSSRVLRGGTWKYDAQYCRSARRNSPSSPDPTYNSILYGFRVVLALNQ